MTSPIPPPPKKPIVVVVEDDLMLLEFYEKTLHSICEIHTFTSGETALSFVKNHSQISLAIVDLNLPDINGEKLCSLLRTFTNQPHLPIIVISGLANIDKIMELMKREQIKTYITKPITRKILKDHVLTYL